MSKEDIFLAGPETSRYIRDLEKKAIHPNYRYCR
jgi:hypothetical protein